jgi:hypothetical protein
VTGPAQRKSEPAPLNDDDVEAMARGDTTSVARRIARHSPSKRTGKLTDDNSAPAEITAAEMRQIQRSGRLSKALRERLAAGTDLDDTAEPPPSAKQSPKREPGAAAP